MTTSFEKSVKGATKPKLAAPKSKYVEHILIATHTGEAGVAEIFRTLQNRLRDSTWTVAFKSLIIVHLMIREGEPNETLKFLSSAPVRKLAINRFTEAQTYQAQNIRTYVEYIQQRAISFGHTKVDFVRGGEGRLKRLTVDKGLLRETESVQDQIKALLRCEFLSRVPENEITLTAFRLLTMDLLVLFHVMNEGTINVLEHYFEMSHTDAERALDVYEAFVQQTDQVVQYLSIARHYEHATRLEIPKLKHAPTSLLTSLKEYLNDKDFEINRRQYLAQQEAKRSLKSANGISKPTTDNNPAPSKAAVGQSFPSVKNSAPAEPQKQAPKGPAPDLIDFFESIEQNQQPMAQPQVIPQHQQPQQQMPQQAFPQDIHVNPTGFIPQPMIYQQQQQPFMPVHSTGNPFGPPQQPPSIATAFPGAPLGGAQTFSPQQTAMPQMPPMPQPGQSPFQPQVQQQFATGPATQLQPQSTNPFRQSMMPNATGIPNTSLAPSPNNALNNRASTNPFAKPPTQQAPGAISPFAPNPSIQISQPSPFGQQLQLQQQHQPQLQPQPQLQQQPQQQQPPQQLYLQQPHPQPQQPLQSAPTGTNPFARNPSPISSQQTPPNLSATTTGSTNPFRQSAFVNQQTGQGWQTNQQGTMGGLEQLPTIPVFPRPGQGPQSRQ